MEKLYGVSPKDGLAMWVADMDFKAPEAVNSCIKNMSEHGIHGYFGDDSGYKTALRSWMSKKHNWEIEDSWSPEINLNVSVLIPESFVKDLDVRLSLYRKLSNLRNSEDLESFAVELHDRFGTLPREVLMLINIVKIKNKCLDAGIIKFEGGPRGAIVKFYKDKFNEPERLLEYIKKQGDLIKVRENKLIIRRDWKDLKDKIKGAYSIVSDLANLVKK